MGLEARYLTEKYCYHLEICNKMTQVVLGEIQNMEYLLQHARANQRSSIMIHTDTRKFNNLRADI